MRVSDTIEMAPTYRQSQLKTRSTPIACCYQDNAICQIVFINQHIGTVLLVIGHRVAQIVGEVVMVTA